MIRPQHMLLSPGEALLIRVQFLFKDKEEQISETVKSTLVTSFNHPQGTPDEVGLMRNVSPSRSAVYFSYKF